MHLQDPCTCALLLLPVLAFEPVLFSLSSVFCLNQERSNTFTRSAGFAMDAPKAPEVAPATNFFQKGVFSEMVVIPLAQFWGNGGGNTWVSGVHVLFHHIIPTHAEGRVRRFPQN